MGGEGVMARPFSRILIANRGEIAVRVARTARAMGYASVAVYSDADADALHVITADEAVRIGPPPAPQSYLDMAAIIAAAKASGADALHPGYGFLSENADFAQACGDAGLVFIGPPPSAIRAMGNKAAAKRLMIEAGVPCVPGYQGEDQGDKRLTEEARRIGFPVMVKAAAGGGGRGMRLVSKAEDLAAALSSARSEAKNAFGSGELILEKVITDGRHVEIQVFADAHGNVVHLGERDCSVQRRHQKVIEEAPSPAVSPELRTRMGADAVAAARAIGYRGAGTVEFMLDASGHFYFLEMNTRLQVEHPVTEMITGLDLVDWQLRVAAGERLPWTQDEIDEQFSGHAIEVRLYAEAPHRNFLPQTGKILAWQPPEGTGIRVDAGIRPGQVVTPYYDPMLAKVIAHGETREDARKRLVAALRGLTLLGLETNRAFLIAMLQHPEFSSGTATTAFIARNFAPGSAGLAKPAASTETVAIAAAAMFEFDHRAQTGMLAGWRSTGPAPAPLRLEIAGKRVEAAVTPHGGGRYVVGVGSETVDLYLCAADDGGAGRSVRLTARVGSATRTVRCLLDRDTLHLDIAGATLTARDVTFAQAERAEKDGAGRLVAPMNGRIVSVQAKAGDKVAKGQRLVVLEAMKMQHEITAGRAGTIASVAVKDGDQVATQQVLVTLAAEAGDGAAEKGKPS